MTNAFPQYPKRDFSPYAIDGCDIRIDCDSPRVSSRSKSSLLISPPSESYDLKLDEKSHQYEDPSNLCDQVRVLQQADRRPRKCYNDMYEPHIPLKNLGGLRRSTESVSSDGLYTRESCLNRCLLLFVLLTSLTALILVVLMMLGKVGTSQCACNTEQRTHEVQAPRGEQFVSPDEPANKNDSPPDVQSLNKKIKQLRGNMSLIKAALEVLQTDITATKSDIHATNSMINGTTNRLSTLEVDTQVLVAQTRSNISRQINEALSTTNDSFQFKLASLRAVFMTKLNDTAQNLLNADVSLESSLNTINSSLSAQVQSISKLQGPTGPPGFNGSTGMKGAKGADGPQGDSGAQGDQGLTGADGEDGSNGGDGPTGPVGEKGAKGQKGDKGDQGVSGSQGPQGPQGPQGAGNFSQCSYKVKDHTGSPSQGGAGVVVDITETQDKKFLGVTCSTNNAAEYNLDSRLIANGRLYECTCKGISQLFGNAGQNTNCHIHYWECPLTT